MLVHPSSVPVDSSGFERAGNLGLDGGLHHHATGFGRGPTAPSSTSVKRDRDNVTPRLSAVVIQSRERGHHGSHSSLLSDASGSQLEGKSMSATNELNAEETDSSEMSELLFDDLSERIALKTTKAKDSSRHLDEKKRGHRDDNAKRWRSGSFSMTSACGLLVCVDRFDKWASHRIHQMCLGKLDYLFVPGAFVFGSQFMFITILLLSLFVRISGFMFTAFSCIFTVLITQGTKKYYGRIRPELSCIQRRKVDFRTRLTNHSFPSGDTAQASAYGMCLYYLTKNPWFLVLIPVTAWSRVYFGCHYIADCVFGAMIGVSVAAFMWSFVPLSAMSLMEDRVVYFILNAIVH